MEKPNNYKYTWYLCSVFSEVKAVVVSAVVVFVALVVIVAAAVIVGAVGIVAGVVVIVMHQTGSWQSHNKQPSPLRFFQKAEGGIRRVSNQCLHPINHNRQLTLILLRV